MNVDEFLEFYFPGVNAGDPTEAVCISEIVGVDDKGRPLWKQTRWRPGTMPDSLGKHYFCISTVVAGPRDGAVRRQMTDLKRTWLIGLDDIGTAPQSKIDPGLIKARPTTILETSPGNHQYLYKLEAPMAPLEAAALIRGLAKAGLTDKGAQGANRVLRLPGSLNTKYAEPFRTRVVS